MKRRAVLVTGSRDWTDVGLIRARIAYHKRRCDELVVIHGDCPRGADARAHICCHDLGVPVLPMAAQWGAYEPKGRAGPYRNSDMLDVMIALSRCGYEVYGEAFGLKQSKGGTRDMVRKLQGQQIETAVWEEGDVAGGG